MRRPAPGQALAWARSSALDADPAAAAAAGGATGLQARQGLRHGRKRDANAISHHYDVSNRFYEMVLGPSMTYTCACYPTEDATLEEAQAHKYDLVARKLGLEPGMRLLDVGCGWGGMVRHAAKDYGVKVLGVTLSREQATWAQERIKDERLDHLAEVRHLDYRDVRESGLRRGQLDRPDRAHRRAELSGVLLLPARHGCAPVAGCSTTASPGRTTSTPGCRGAASSAATCSRTAS